MFKRKSKKPEPIAEPVVAAQVVRPGMADAPQPIAPPPTPVAPAPVQQASPVQEEAPAESTELTEEQAMQALYENRGKILEHDARIQSIEAAIYRLKALV